MSPLPAPVSPCPGVLGCCFFLLVFDADPVFPWLNPSCARIFWWRCFVSSPLRVAWIHRCLHHDVFSPSKNFLICNAGWGVCLSCGDLAQGDPGRLALNRQDETPPVDSKLDLLLLLSSNDWCGCSGIDSSHTTISTLPTGSVTKEYWRKTVESPGSVIQTVLLGSIILVPKQVSHPTGSG